MNAVAVVCTRMNSRRLPGKAMKKIAGVPAIVHIIRRLKKTGLRIVLAMPENESFGIPGSELEQCDIYRGQDGSPLHRIAEVLKIYDSAQYVVRVTHDDILIDPQTILELLKATEDAKAGYGTSPGIVEGAGVEVIHRENIIDAALRRKEPTEFVSYFVHGDSCPRKGWFKLEPRKSIKRDYRMTLDFQEDFLVLEAALRATGADADLDTVVSYMDDNIGLRCINRLPELSIYTCCYNAENTVAESVYSAQRAAWKLDIEHIIVDDASTDKTLTEALSSLNHNDGFRKVVLTNDSNFGLASSSNKALAECRGKYVMRLDADDELLGHEFVSEWPLIARKLEQGAQVVYPAYLQGTSLIHPLPENENGFKRAVKKNPWEHHHVGGAVFDRAFLNELRFRDGLRHWDGKELHRRLIEVGAKIAYHTEPVWFYRDTPHSMSKSDPETRKNVLKEIEQ